MLQKKSERSEKQTMVICLRIHRRGVSRRRLVHTLQCWCINNSSWSVFLDHRYRKRMEWKETA